MSKHRVTLKDIANQLGTTATTVSKALKDYPDIGKETKRKVKELAKKLNYTPDIQALALRNQKTYTIGLILPEIVHFFFSNVIKGIMEESEKQGYKLLITLSDNDQSLEEKQMNLFFNTKVDGVLVSLANNSTNANHFNKLIEYDIPVVFFDKVDLNFKSKQVVVDDFDGAYKATKHLIEKGCRNIAHISGPQIPMNAIERKNGFLHALKEANIEVNKNFIKECKMVTFEEGYDYAKELLTLPIKPDGIFGVTDQIAVGALHAAKDLDIKVPEELKIVGFSDSQIARISKPQLTTIHQPGYEIGVKSAQLLFKEIEISEKSDDYQPQFEKVVLDTYLIERGTT